MRYFDYDGAPRRIMSILKGAVGGFWMGMIIGVLIMVIYLGGIKKADISGEDSLALALGAIPGAPIGIAVGIFLSYSKRNNKRWRIFFLVVFFLAVLQFTSPIIYSFIRAIQN